MDGDLSNRSAHCNGIDCVGYFRCYDFWVPVKSETQSSNADENPHHARTEAHGSSSVTTPDGSLMGEESVNTQSTLDQNGSALNIEPPTPSSKYILKYGKHALVCLCFLLLFSYFSFLNATTFYDSGEEQVFFSIWGYLTEKNYLAKENVSFFTTSPTIIPT